MFMLRGDKEPRHCERVSAKQSRALFKRSLDCFGATRLAMTGNTMSGFILFFVLIFLQLISILSLIALKNSRLEIKMSHDSRIRYQTFYSAEKAILQAENHFLQQKQPCLIPETTTDELLSRPMSFWQSDVTCTGNFSTFQYYYVLETLGEDPCGYLENTEKTVDLFRLTLLGSNPNQAIVRLQTIIAVEHDGPASSCQKKIYHVTRGRQSWRELTKGITE
jgi:Tfp pilus assembly protein PilX